MGFYGNIADSSHIHFQFDKIFSSRTAMDRECISGSDGIYAGRFVLVKYDSEVYQEEIQYGYFGIGEQSEILYKDAACTVPYIFTTFSVVSSDNTSSTNWSSYYNKVPEGDSYVRLKNELEFKEGQDYWIANAADGTNNFNLVSNGTIVYLRDTSQPGSIPYICLRCTGETSGEPATWETTSTSGHYQNYFDNYELDQRTYGDGFNHRGYDATVWQKIYGENGGKFILIATLNASQPSIEFIQDPPSTAPLAATIDPTSTEDVYKIHVPTHWGLQFAADTPVEEGGLSDQRVTIKKLVLDGNGNETYDQNGDLITIDTEIDASIYFNKAGFNSTKRSYIPSSGENGVPNRLLLEPTGESGKKYYDFNGNVIKKDTLELSVHVPAIGNMASDGYDLIYGYDENTQNRFTDVDWVEGDRTDDEKYFGLTGLKTHDLNTLAGTLNEMHDKLGQSVIHLYAAPTQANAVNWSDNYIYEYNGNFFRRGIGYKTTRVEDYLYKVDPAASQHFNNYPADEGEDTRHFTRSIGQNGAYIYTPVPATATYQTNVTYYYRIKWCKYTRDLHADSNFTINKYYVTDDNGVTFYPCTDTEYNANRDRDDGGYWLKSINPARFSQITLEPYIKDSFYYMNEDNYICDQQPTAEGPKDPYGQYYRIIDLAAPKRFTNAYRSNYFYRLDTNGDYTRETATLISPTDNRLFYEVQVEDHAFQDIDENDVVTYPPRIIYIPNVFHRYDERNPDAGVTLATEETFTARPDGSLHYYKLEFSTEKIFTIINGVIYEGYPEIRRIEVTDWLVNRAYNSETNTYTTYYYRDTEKNKYTKYENLEVLFGAAAYTTPRIYYTLPSIASYNQNQLYVAGRYYTRDIIAESPTYHSYFKSNNTYLDGDNRWTGNEIDFYTILPENVQKVLYPFYVPGRYYIDISLAQDETEFDIDNNSVKQDRQYYEKTRLFVDYDTRHECPHGFEWNDLAPYVPPSITLYAREEEVTAVPLDKAYSGSTNLSSINDFLLFLNRSFDADNEETRDLTTFRGVYNTLRDILYQIKRLQPGKILFVNDFGQITTGTETNSVNYSDIKALVH